MNVKFFEYRLYEIPLYCFSFVRNGRFTVYISLKYAAKQIVEDKVAKL